MPVNRKLMASLVEQYGEEEGKRIYYAMEEEGDPATKPSAVKKAQRDSPISRAMKGKG